MTGTPQSQSVVKRDPTPEVLQVLVDNHRRFLAFLERRVGSRDIAEDILQDAFVKGLQNASTVHNQQGIVAWFYRLLRNAVVDYYRRGAAEQRALTHMAGWAEEVDPGPDEALRNEICGCVSALVKTLKPEYAQAITKVDLNEVTVAGYAQEVGITPTNAGVRLHRAHDALRRRLIQCCGTCAEHGCLDCACGGPGTKK